MKTGVAPGWARAEGAGLGAEPSDDGSRTELAEAAAPCARLVPSLDSLSSSNSVAIWMTRRATT